MEHTTQSKKLAHPTPLTYMKIAVLLAVITAVKFVLVAMFYMHLRYDNRIFSALFVGGLILATIVIVALLGIFQTFRTSTSSADYDTVEVSSGIIHEDDLDTQKH